MTLIIHIKVTEFTQTCSLLDDWGGGGCLIYEYFDMLKAAGLQNYTVAFPPGKSSVILRWKSIKVKLEATVDAGETFLLHAINPPAEE